MSHITPTRHGFKYSKVVIETNALAQFWKRHLSDTYSGEVHVEKQDLDRVLGLVERQRLGDSGRRLSTARDPEAPGPGSTPST